jgi:hypothetical protein
MSASGSSVLTGGRLGSNDTNVTIPPEGSAMKRIVPAARWTMVVLSLVFGLGSSAEAASVRRHASRPSRSHIFRAPAPSSRAAWSRSSGTTSSIHASTGLTRQKTVHVKGYTKKDGTKVEGHDRKAPTKKRATATARAATTAHSTTTRSTTPARDSKGRFIRSATAKDAFLRQTGYPHGRPGWVVDHIVPLACGGADAPSNMQWQTVQEAKVKDKTERAGCGK